MARTTTTDASIRQVWTSTSLYRRRLSGAFGRVQDPGKEAVPGRSSCRLPSSAPPNVPASSVTPLSGIRSALWRALERNFRSSAAAAVIGGSRLSSDAWCCSSSPGSGSRAGTRRCRAAIGKPSTPPLSCNPAARCPIPATGRCPTWSRCVRKGAPSPPDPARSKSSAGKVDRVESFRRDWDLSRVPHRLFFWPQGDAGTARPVRTWGDRSRSPPGTAGARPNARRSCRRS